MKKIYSILLILLVGGFLFLFIQMHQIAVSEMEKIQSYGLVAIYFITIAIGFLLSNVSSHDLKINLDGLNKELRSLSKEKNELEDKNKVLEETTKKALLLTDYTKIIQTTKTYKELSQGVMDKISNDLELVQAAFYETVIEDGIHKLSYESGYAFHLPESQKLTFDFGDGLCGQVAVDKKIIVLEDIPDGYVEVISGLGQASPKHLALIPLLHDGNTIAVMELSSFNNFGETDIDFFNSLVELLAPAFDSLKS